jgi:hypothetical protein
MKRLLVLAMMALCVPAVTAGTNTFGLFYGTHGCGGCGCPGPWNAFSPTNCCCVVNAAGCTLYPGGYTGDPYAAGGMPIGGGQCGPWGCGKWHGYYKHWGCANPFAYDLPLPYPCGALMAFTGTPGGLGCGDPYNGCGSALKHPFLTRLAHGCCKATNPPPEHLCDYLKGGWGLGLGHKLGWGGHAACDGCVASPVIEAPAAPAPAKMPHTVDAPVYQPVSYQPGYYYPSMYYGYNPTWGYYPAYGYPMGR